MALAAYPAETAWQKSDCAAAEAEAIYRLESSHNGETRLQEKMIWVPRINVGDSDLLYSGTVVVNGNAKIRIIPVPAAPTPFYVDIVFDDNAGLLTGINVANAVDKGVTVTLTNFGLFALSSTVKPVAVANLNGQPVLLAIVAQPIGMGDSLVRVISLSFYGKANV